MEDDGRVMWLGLEVVFFLLCRASELWAYSGGKVYPEFCLTRECLTFSREGENKCDVKKSRVRD